MASGAFALFIKWTSIHPYEIQRKTAISLETFVAQRFHDIAQFSGRQIVATGGHAKPADFDRLQRPSYMNGTPLKQVEYFSNRIFREHRGTLAAATAGRLAMPLDRRSGGPRRILSRHLRHLVADVHRDFIANDMSTHARHRRRKSRLRAQDIRARSERHSSHAGTPVRKRCRPHVAAGTSHMDDGELSGLRSR